MTARQLVLVLVVALIACGIAALLAWRVRVATFIPEPAKGIIIWIIWTVLALAFVFWLLTVSGLDGKRLW